jgi:hypothetical protein
MHGMNKEASHCSDSTQDMLTGTKIGRYESATLTTSRSTDKAKKHHSSTEAITSSTSRKSQKMSTHICCTAQLQVATADFKMAPSSWNHCVPLTLGPSEG